MKRQKIDKIELLYRNKKNTIAMWKDLIKICVIVRHNIFTMANNSWIRDNDWMQGTQKMNSCELQKSFHSVYKNFYNTHDMVLSANSVLTWWADISHGVSSLRIKQKMPLNYYCWVKSNTSGGITFGNVFYYSVLHKNFKEETFDILLKYNTEKITSYISNFLSEHEYKGGIDINFLFEVPPWHGFASSGTISVLVTYLLHMIVGLLDPKIIRDNELSVDDPIFNELYTFSKKLLDCISGGKSTGASNYAIMVPSNPLPVVCLSKYRVDAITPSVAEDDVFHIPQSTVFYTDTIERFLWLWNGIIRELPIDYGIIFTGVEYNMMSEIKSKKEGVKNDNQQLADFVGNIIDLLPLEKEDRKNISALINAHETSNKIIDSTNFKILNGFHQLLTNNHDDDGINWFINIIRNIWFMSFSYQKANKLFFDLHYLFYQYKQFEDEEIAFIPFNTWKIGGSLLFVMKSWKSRITLQKVLDHLQNNGQIAILDHASWRDGSASTGVSLEQYISKKIYSSYTKEGNVSFSDTFGASYCADYHSVIDNEIHGILLDTITGRIYIQWIKLTSKEIHSQNTTIDMLRLLLENMGQEVSNSELPVSTYSQNKNEILSKVVLPIKKITKEYFGTEISLSCSGGITDYFLRLQRDDAIRIGIIKKL